MGMIEYGERDTVAPTRDQVYVAYGDSILFSSSLHASGKGRCGLSNWLVSAGIAGMGHLFRRSRRKGRTALQLAGVRGPWREYGQFSPVGHKRSLRRSYGKRGNTV